MTLASKPSTGADWLMSSARPCGRPSTISIITTSSATSFSAIRRAVLEPTFPAPTTVALLIVETLLVLPGALELFDNRVCHLRSTHCAGIVTIRLHVVGDALSFLDHSCDCCLEAIGRIPLLEVVKHQDAGEHHRHGVYLVLTRVLGV